MPTVTVRNLPEEIHRALTHLAAHDGSSVAAVVRAILEDVVRPDARLKIGSELAAFGRRFAGLDLDITRGQTPAELAQGAIAITREQEC